eukprot:TRINITY_DN19495_c0_g1_i2.p2 TRINITY_DN19495_c0_g1~~TRINITY_DN19495_c0_g1_i2.p2  ORF type:complete len:115 (+),score=1.56 TRINITY_DN19495_c0_g1_i2:157-501(+)
MDGRSLVSAQQQGSVDVTFALSQQLQDQQRQQFVSGCFLRCKPAVFKGPRIKRAGLDQLGFAQASLCDLCTDFTCHLSQFVVLPSLDKRSMLPVMIGEQPCARYSCTAMSPLCN